MVGDAAASRGNITVVLHQTRSPVNVGASARAMANFGLRRLLLTDPDGFDMATAARVAAQAGELLETALVAPSLEDAWDRFALVIVSSARVRPDRPSLGPAEAMQEIWASASAGSQVALVFGNERRGLPRWAIERAHHISHIPSDAAAPSLNLAQAVLLHAWQLHLCTPPDSTEPTGPGPNEGIPSTATPMTAHALATLRKRARALLLDVSYLDPQNPDKVLSELERLLLRATPSEREAGLLLSALTRLEYARPH